MSKRLIAEEVVQMMNLFHYDRGRTASNQNQFNVIEEQATKLKTSEGKAKVKKKGSDDWKLVVTKDAQFDPKNLNANDIAFVAIQQDPKVQQHIQKIKKQHPDFTLGPENIILSNRDKFWTGKKTDRYIFMIDPTPTRERIEKMETILVKKVDTIENKNDQPKPQLTKALSGDTPSGEVIAKEQEEKIYHIPGDKTWEYLVKDEVWYTRKLGQKDWISLKNNEKANGVLDKHFRDAREAQVEIPSGDTPSGDTPSGDVLSKEQQNELIKDVKILKDNVGSKLSYVNPQEMEQYLGILEKWNKKGKLCVLVTAYDCQEAAYSKGTLLEDLKEISDTHYNLLAKERETGTPKKTAAKNAAIKLVTNAKCPPTNTEMCIKYLPPKDNEKTNLAAPSDPLGGVKTTASDQARDLIQGVTGVTGVGGPTGN